MDANWLSTEISKLLVSPHISFPKPPAGIRLGPGPVDLFSTVFNNIFAPDVVATVDGEKVSRDELKQKLLNLQKHWKSDEVKVQEEPPRGKDLVTVAYLPPGERVLFVGETEEQGGGKVIKKFGMEGDSTLFQ